MTAQAWLVAENNGVVCDPQVRQLASELGVRLAYLSGSGPSGRPTRSDVLTAGARLDAEHARAQAVVRPRSARTPEAPLPAFTASGLDPEQLRSVPPSVRPAMAAAPTLAEAYRLKETYGGTADEQARQQLRADHAVSPQHGGYYWPTD
jgi:pyruvate/2-oxoglutarate dehydrogenase complex dihydrolipoamide acyltransferase (E2) component